MDTINWEKALTPYLDKYKDMERDEMRHTDIFATLKQGTAVFTGVILRERDNTYLLNGFAQYLGKEYHVVFKTTLR